MGGYSPAGKWSFLQLCDSPNPLCEASQLSLCVGEDFPPVLVWCLSPFHSHWYRCSRSLRLGKSEMAERPWISCHQVVLSQCLGIYWCLLCLSVKVTLWLSSLTRRQYQWGLLKDLRLYNCPRMLIWSFRCQYRDMDLYLKGLKSLYTRDAFNFSYQLRLPCFNPYKLLFNLRT